MSNGSSLGEVPNAVPATAGAAQATDVASRTHLVVVTTRAIEASETTTAGAVLRTRFWHPRDHRWSENDFESLEHARRLFIEESGWVLRQEQRLDRDLAHELIFEAHRADFARPSQEEILREVGLTPEGVNRLLERVDRDKGDAGT